MRVSLCLCCKYNHFIARVNENSATLQVLHAAMPSDQVPYALAGAVVGLAVASQPRQPVHSMDAVFRTCSAEAPLACLALGIVRAVDVERGLLYLLTPLSEAAMLLVDTLQVKPVPHFNLDFIFWSYHFQ